MPSIKDAVNTNLSGYSLLPAKPPVISIIPTNSSPASNLRCPLPPFNADPDSLRQFENSTTGPKNRVWPLPQQSGGVSTTTIVTNTTNTVSSGSGSGSGSSTTLVSKVVSVTTGLLISGINFQGFVTMARSFQLQSLLVTSPCEVRLYGTATAQASDAYRATGDPVPPEVSANILSCVTFDTVPYTWGFQNRCGGNQASPQTTTIYVSVINTVPSSEAPVTVTIQFLPLEN